MIVISLFDGMSCGREALDRANIAVSRYYASEIDKYAMIVAQANWSDNVQIGDVRIVRQMCEAGLFGHVDMLIGGSPCQNLSFAGKQDGFSVEITDLEHYKQLVAEGFEFKGQSYLFWEYVWIREILKPTWWLLENVKMNKKYLKIFDEIMGVEGVFINSALVSAQNRQRYYWCNWPVSQPEDRGIYLRDIIESGEVDREKSYCIDANYYKGGSLKNYLEKSRRQIVLSPESNGYNSVIQINPDKSAAGKQPHMQDRVYHPDGKSIAVTSTFGNRLNVATGRELLGISITENGIRPYKNDGRKGSFSEIGTIKTPDHKSSCLTSAHAPKITTQLKNKSNTIRVGGGSSPPDSRQCWDNVYDSKITYRKLTPIECERLQGIPDNYTNHVSNTQRYKMLGNGWQVDTIVHILQELKQWGAL